MTETDAESRRAPAEALATGNGGSHAPLDASVALAWRYEQLRALHEMTEAGSRAEDVEGIDDVALVRRHGRRMSSAHPLRPPTAPR